jgi:hypothetical protein
MPFAYRGMDFEAVKMAYGTYLDRANIGAYHKDELIGIIKIVYVGELACLMQIFKSTTMIRDRRMH